MTVSLPDDTIDDLVYQFAVAPHGWYAARASGLYRSTDGGASWRLAYESLGAGGALSTLSVAACTGPDRLPLVFAGLSGELLRSTDAGETWELAPKPRPAPIFTALAPSPDFARDGTLFAGTIEDGVLTYADSGRAWMMWNFGLLDTNVLCLAVSPAFATDRAIFAGVQSGLFRSSDGGRSWREVDLPGGYGAVLCLALSPRFAEDGALYAGTESSGMLCSDDGGRSWRRIGQNLLTEPINSILVGPDFPVKPELLVLHGGELLFSADGGETWGAWRGERLAGLQVTAALAPRGFDDGAPVLIGASGGEIYVV